MSLNFLYLSLSDANLQANLDQLARTRYVPPSARACVYMGLGQKEIAPDWLEKACAERDTDMTS